MKPALSIVVPALNEAPGIEATRLALQPLRVRDVELVLADGGSTDGTAERAAPWAEAVTTSARGRAVQMNAGAALPRADAVLFLHADTRLPPLADVLVLQALAGGARWGRFDVHIDGRPWMLRVVAGLTKLRSRLSGIATGDQANFVTRAAFDRVGGFPVQPLMEGIEISRRLKRLRRPACLPARTGLYLGPALGAARRLAHHRADVAPALALLAWRIARAAGAGVPMSAARPLPPHRGGRFAARRSFPLGGTARSTKGAS
jgi:rSAM/selenodomain-associated transferase 2